MIFEMADQGGKRTRIFVINQPTEGHQGFLDRLDVALRQNQIDPTFIGPSDPRLGSRSYGSMIIDTYFGNSEKPIQWDRTPIAVPAFDLVIACMFIDPRDADKAGNAFLEIGAWLALHSDNRLLVFRDPAVILPFALDLSRDYIFTSTKEIDRANEVAAFLAAFLDSPPDIERAQLRVLFCDEPALAKSSTHQTGGTLKSLFRSVTQFLSSCLLGLIPQMREVTSARNLTSTDIARSLASNLIETNGGSIKSGSATYQIVADVLSDVLSSPCTGRFGHLVPQSLLRWKSIVNEYDFAVFVTGPDQDKRAHHAGVRSFLMGYWCARRKLHGQVDYFDVKFVVVPNATLPSDISSSSVLSLDAGLELTHNHPTHVKAVQQLSDSLRSLVDEVGYDRLPRRSEPLVKDLMETFPGFKNWGYADFQSSGPIGAKAPNDLLGPSLSLICYAAEYKRLLEALNESKAAIDNAFDQMRKLCLSLKMTPGNRRSNALSHLAGLRPHHLRILDQNAWCRLEQALGALGHPVYLDGNLLFELRSLLDHVKAEILDIRASTARLPAKSDILSDKQTKSFEKSFDILLYIRPSIAYELRDTLSKCETALLTKCQNVPALGQHPIHPTDLLATTKLVARRFREHLV